MANNNINVKISVDSSELKGANQELNQTKKHLSDTGTLANSSGKKMNKFGVAMQQTGYQVGDFIVQVQSGQNAMVAFGQQATQLVGILPMFNSFMGLSGTALVGLSAGLGIAIPLTTAAGAALMKAGKSAKSFEDQIKETEGVLEGYFKLLKENSSTFKAAFDGAEKSLKLTSQASKDLLSIAKIEAFDSITDLNESLVKSALNAKTFKTELEDAGNLIGAGFGEVIAANLGGKLGDQVNELYSSLYRLKEAGTLQEQYEAAVKIRDIFKSNVDVTGQMTDRQKVFWKELSTTILKMELLGAATDLTNASFERSSKSIKQAIELYHKNNEALKARGDAVREIKNSVEEESRTLQDQINLQGLILDFGKDSAQVKAEIVKQERAALEEQLKSKGILGNNLKSVMALYDEKVRLQKAAEDVAAAEKAAADEAKELTNQARAAAAALRGLEGIGQGIARGLAVAKAELVALNNEASTGIATKIAGQRFDLNKALSDAIAGGADRQSAIAEYIKGRQQLVELEATLLEIEKARELQSQATTSAATSGTQEQIEKTLELSQSMQDQIAIFETMQDALGDGFLSMVDGTKSVEDAFKDMAKSVISELYRVYVLQQMIGGLGQGSSAGTGLLGGLQSILGLPNIPAKASGGTVMPNQPYLVGEKGPELIMPQNRGHVMNADLTSKVMGGVGGGVNQTFYFNFQANGDDSVKKIIAQAAPSIANMAKQSVMDARRRGGAMKNAFG